MSSVFKVKVVNGFTTNLKKNFRAIDGDMEGIGPFKDKSTPALADGEYHSNGFEFVLQYDDNEGTWVMCFDPQYAMSEGWPTRHSLYFFRNNILMGARNSPHVEPAESEAAKSTEKRFTQVEMDAYAREAFNKSRHVYKMVNGRPVYEFATFEDFVADKSLTKIEKMSEA